MKDHRLSCSCELKWSRKPPKFKKEIISRDAEVFEGVHITAGQDQAMYLLNNPEHITHQKRSCRPSTISPAYQNVYYLLVPRDHWLWIDPTDDTALIEFEAFAKVMEGDQNLLALKFKGISKQLDKHQAIFAEQPGTHYAPEEVACRSRLPKCLLSARAPRDHWLWIDPTDDTATYRV